MLNLPRHLAATRRATHAPFHCHHHLVRRCPPARRYASVSTESQKDPAELGRISTLPNGVRVATEALPGPFSGIGVYIDAGSRYEDESIRGVSHIIDRLAFKSTKQRTSDQMLQAVESLGGNLNCASSRESLMYQSASFNSSVETSLELLAETVRDPIITEEEVAQQLETAEYEIGEIWSKPDLILPELVHSAAYKDNTLGNPLLCPAERLQEINKATVDSYRQRFFHPERMVVAFAGVEHDKALDLTNRYFGNMSTSHGRSSSSANSGKSRSENSSSTNSFSASSSVSSLSSTPSSPSAISSKIKSHVPFFKNLSTSASKSANVLSSDAHSFSKSLSELTAPSHYTGGFIALPPIPPPANKALPRVSHIHLAFEAPPISSPDIYALATLQTLLGGGGSFSAGGPGKGMYSRLYTNVLNEYGWVESCMAFNHPYTDSGLFGISASCSPRGISQMLDAMCRELQALSRPNGISALQHEEVERAKNQLRSSLLMNLESRMVELEDLGRQVQVHGRRVGVKEMCEKIENLTVHDLRRVAGEVFGGGVYNAGKGTGLPTVALQEGEEEGFSRKDFEWSDIQERIARWKLGRP